jgi:hypothetical protein
MEALIYSETLVLTRATRRNIPRRWHSSLLTESSNKKAATQEVTDQDNDEDDDEVDSVHTKIAKNPV